MVFSKSANYTLSQLALEQRYIPTFRGATHKSQICASRTANADEFACAVFRTLSGWELPFFLTIRSELSLAVIVIWARAVVSAVAPFNKAIEEDTMVC